MTLKITEAGKEDKKELKEKRSKLGKKSKRKGSNFERTVAKKFKEALNVDLVRTPLSGGFAKNDAKSGDFRGDIVSSDASIDLKFHVECKNTKSWSLPSWLKQAEGDCPDNKIPLVVFHKDGTSKDYVCLSLDDLFKVLNKEFVIIKK